MLLMGLTSVIGSVSFDVRPALVALVLVYAQKVKKKSCEQPVVFQ